MHRRANVPPFDQKAHAKEVLNQHVNGKSPHKNAARTRGWLFTRRRASRRALTTASWFPNGGRKLTLLPVTKHPVVQKRHRTWKQAGSEMP